MQRKLPAKGSGNQRQGVYDATEDITPDYNVAVLDPMSEYYTSSGKTDYGPYYQDVLIADTDPWDSSRGGPVTNVPRWPNPSTGGKPGAGNQLGWTSGIQYRRWLTTPFKGQHLTLAGNKAHDTRGPVGRKDWLGGLATRVPYQFVETSPTPQQVAQAFTFAPSKFADEWSQQSIDSTGEWHP